MPGPRREENNDRHADHQRGEVPCRAQETDEDRKRELDEELDEALQETFPASDPVSMTSTLKPGKRRGRPSENSDS